MTKQELNKILSLHKQWLKNRLTGERATFTDVSPSIMGERMSLNLSLAYLPNVQLSNCSMVKTNFKGANLSKANLSHSFLRNSCLAGVYASGANFTGANLVNVDFTNACLIGADFTNANLVGANFYDADLRGAKLKGVILDPSTLFLAPQCPEEGSFIGWKRLKGGAIAKLFIPASAKRSSATSLKCRASKAKVLAIFDVNGNPIKEGVSIHYTSLAYKVGQTVTPEESFDTDRFNECSSGIHFFMSRTIAENY